MLFDRYLRSRWKSRRAGRGLALLHVYGAREQHKGRMASVAWHFFNQYVSSGRFDCSKAVTAMPMASSAATSVSVEDCVKVNLHFLDHPQVSGIFNVGTGRGAGLSMTSRRPVINTVAAARGQPPRSIAELVRAGCVEYIPFPADLKGKYQAFTQADLGALRGGGLFGAFPQCRSGREALLRRAASQER